MEVDGMVCHSCVQNIEMNIGKMTGVHEIKVSLSDKNARIQDDPSLISPSKLCNAILDIGLNAEVQGAVETGTATSCKTRSQQEQGKTEDNVFIMIYWAEKKEPGTRYWCLLSFPRILEISEKSALLH